VTNASRTLLMNLNTLQWSNDACEYVASSLDRADGCHQLSILIHAHTLANGR